MRSATMEDATLLHEWVNRPDVRASALSGPAPIPYDRHVDWLTGKLADPACRIWMIMSGQKAVGQVRIDREDQALAVDIFVDNPARKRGVAARAVTLALAAARRCIGPGPALARVRLENTASQALFESLGFRRRTTGHDHHLYWQADES